MTSTKWARRAAAALMALAFAAPAAAQSAGPGPNTGGLPVPGIELGGDKYVDPATVEKRKEIDRAYRDATRQIPPQAAATNDPWANMRGADEAKSAPRPKPAASGAKTTGKTAATTAQKKKPAAQ
jgi:hypothetical protein